MCFLTVAVEMQVMSHVCQRLQDVVGHRKQEVGGEQPGEAEDAVAHGQRDCEVAERTSKGREGEFSPNLAAINILLLIINTERNISTARTFFDYALKPDYISNLRRNLGKTC